MLYENSLPNGSDNPISHNSWDGGDDAKTASGSWAITGTGARREPGFGVGAEISIWVAPGVDGKTLLLLRARN